MASAQTRPEPMNASPYHSKVKVSLMLADPLFVAGTHVAGKMEVECRADKGLGIEVMMVELFGYQELTSRDHTATSTFLHSRRLFQGPGLPPSNAVQAHPLPGDPPLPLNYHQARRGISTFLFRLPIPSTSPSTINFGSDLARVKYELRASVGVFWKGEKRLVTNKRDLDVVEGYDEDFSWSDPEAVIVGEHGKVWMHGRIVGGIIVAGESACLELQVKNHSSKKNTGLSLSLTRMLILPGMSDVKKPSLQISDTLANVSFKGPEYIIAPGVEGVANLVFDVPKHARSVRGGALEGSESEARTTESLFEIQCVVSVKLSMGLGSKDIQLDIPVPIVHPLALPELPTPDPYQSRPGYPYTTQMPYSEQIEPWHPHPSSPLSSPVPALVDPTRVWLPPPASNAPHPYQYFSPPIEGQHYYFPPPPNAPVYVPVRPVSAGLPANNLVLDDSAASFSQHLLLPLDAGPLQAAEPEEGKGERAMRVTQHLRLSSRHRSVSPQSHRFPMPSSRPLPVPSASTPPQRGRSLPSPPLNLPAQDMLSLTPEAGVVHSPRPVLSPKHSFSKDLITNDSLPKSERVEQLERMADEVAAVTSDLSGDIPKETVSEAKAEPKLHQRQKDEPADMNKTLPVPPPPTRNGKRLSPFPQRKRVDSYFDVTPIPQPPASQPAPLDRAPPTPTLTAVTPAKLPRQLTDKLELNVLGQGESGLDALERRLLAEVGTRKIEASAKHPDVRSVVQPIAIPSASTDSEPLHDSAISSLTLAGGDAERPEGGLIPVLALEQEPDHELEQEHDSDERTHRAGKSSVSGDERSRKSKKARSRRGHDGGLFVTDDRSGKRDSEDERRSGRKRERGRTREVDAYRTKKSAAKGKVAAWLGAIDPEVPPLDGLVPPNLTVDQNVVRLNEEAPAVTEISQDSKTPEDVNMDDVDAAVSSAPNPRSSGFVPIGTFKRDTFHRRPHAKDVTVEEEAKKVAELWSSSPAAGSPTTPLISPARARQSIRTDRRVSPPSASPIRQGENQDKVELIPNLSKQLRPSVVIPALQSPERRPVQPSSRLPVFSPQARLDPEVKYDIRSARGGRGGIVTSVAAIWASGGLSEAPKSNDAGKATPAVPSPHRANRVLSKRNPQALATTTPDTTVPKITEPSPARRLGPVPVIKSSSVPAIISSSHATPTLSSTASLARSAASAPRTKPALKTIVETEPKSDVRSQGATPKVGPMKTSGAADLAFGQARLRDLIKKYQGT